MTRGIAVLILSIVAVICTSALILAIRPELLLFVGLYFGGAA